jgi:hypothetical protein
MKLRSTYPLLLIALMLLGFGMGGCSQQIGVEGRSDRLYAEAKGALLSEGFRSVGRSGAVAGAKGSDPRAGRLQFLYYGDTLAPTIVEVQIQPSVSGPDAEQATVAVAPTPASGRPGADGKSGDQVGPGSKAAVAQPPVLLGAHLVIVKAWSSITFAPDPFITDLAMGVLRRAYSLSGNAP